VLWCPSYHDIGSPAGFVGSAYSNLIYFATTDSGVGPTNLGFCNGGVGQDGSSSFSIRDPCYNLINGDTVQDARTLAACITITNTGKLIDTAGEIAVVNGLSTENILGAGTPISVDQLFAYTTHKSRFEPKSYESVFRPDESSAMFRDADRQLLVAAVDSFPSVPVANTPQAPTWFGFIWRGITAGTPLILDFTKVIEWRPEASSGLTQGNRVAHEHTASQVVAAVDRAHRVQPIWHRAAGAHHAAMPLLRMLARSTYSGRGTDFARQLMMSNTNSSRRIGNQQSMMIENVD